MGRYLDMMAQNRPPKSLFSVNDIPDLSEQVIIVTGGNTGVGKETVKALLSHNAKVYVASRSEEKARAAIKDLKEQTGKEALFLKLDLGDLRSVRAAAEQFKSKESRLDVLFNNAGVMMPPIDQHTVDGYDMQFGTNVTGPFYFTKLLIPVLLSTANSSGKSRVINTTSAMHLLNEGDFSIVQDESRRKKTPPQDLYALSKYAVVVFSKELARRYEDQGLVFISVHPGIIRTDLHRHMKGIKGFAISIAERTLLYEPSQGALTQLYAGTSKVASAMSGQYLIPWAREGKPHPGTQDPKKGEELWKLLEEQVAKMDTA